MDYRLQIARRYLFSRREVSLISIITGISMTGVTLGVAALIVVLSVMNGFYDFVRDLLVSIDPHVRVVSTDARGVENADSLIALTKGMDEVVAAAPYVEGKALLVHDGGSANRVVVVRGVDQEAMAEEQEVVRQTGFGSFDVSTRDGTPGLVAGMGLGNRLGLYPGGSERSASNVGLLSAPSIEQMLTQVFGVPPVRRFEVRGLFEVQAAFDQNHVFISLEEAQRLFRTGSSVTGVDLRLQNLEQAETVKAQLQNQLDGARFEVQTWYDLQKSLYDVMRLEKWGASAILILIVIVAAFNIVGSLTMVVIEKRRDVGVLRAMGVSKSNIKRIFLTEGALIGGVGTGLGLVLGLGLALIQQHFKLVPMAQAESFMIDAYPVVIQPLDIMVIAIVSFGLCVLAAVYPAARAAAIEPAQAVHLDT
ncbi:permease [Longibacter salinarum]|uniref:Permease n=1 Tax=Longibacter salinarum TaxID=1850348 RepID=A0A2A8CW02_9BACT|nr:ABC transporter permease [Longibacter salinarum]PEN12568.1 permease [Longibacter salinarum]